MNETRIFFVTEGIETNRELHETLEDAQAQYKNIPDEDQPQILACMVWDAFWEEDLGVWNYEDHPRTFTDLKVIDSKEFNGGLK